MCGSSQLVLLSVGVYRSSLCKCTWSLVHMHLLKTEVWLGRHSTGHQWQQLAIPIDREVSACDSHSRWKVVPVRGCILLWSMTPACDSVLLSRVIPAHDSITLVSPSLASACSPLGPAVPGPAPVSAFTLSVVVSSTNDSLSSDQCA